MNAHNITPYDSSGNLDLYIRIHIIFPDYFMHQNLKTQTYLKSTSCLIDETFLIPLTEEQSICREALIKLTVKHQGILRFFNTAISDCFIKFGDILDAADKKFFCRLGKLMPDGDNINLRVLQFRREEPIIKEFFKQIQR